MAKNPKSVELRMSNLGIFLFIAIISLGRAQASCRNPNNRSGYCVSIYECPSILEVLGDYTLTTSQRQFIQNSRCTNGYGREPFVCCTPDKDYASNAQTTTTTAAPIIRPNVTPVVTSASNGKGNVLPRPRSCGQPAFANKIYNGKDTALDEYTWMALLEYTDSKGAKVINCGGSLINQRYVLTAAHCIVGAILTQVGRLASIRLGEFDTSQEIDCVSGLCNDKVVSLGYEELVPHPEFNPSNENRHHDIALIRLNADVTYTDYIKPVCLPLPGTATRRSTIDAGELLTVAGWGRTLLARQSNVKQELAIPVVDHSTCSRKFATKNINLITNQLCVGGEFIKDSCDGDSGGPLMRQDSSKVWFLEGVVSFGNRCGLEGWPGVYTRVENYVSWIQENLKP